MKKTIYFGLVLSICLLATGCAAQKQEPSPLPSETTQPSPSAAPTPEPSKSTEVYTRDMVFDDDGNLILNLSENHPANSMAAIWCIKEFTTEEVMKLAPYNDGALATAVCGTLSDRLLNDFNSTIAIIAAADPTTFNGGREHFETTCTGIGCEMYFDLESGIISEDDCAVIFAEHDLTEAEQAVLDKVIEGFNRAKSEYGDS